MSKVKTTWKVNFYDVWGNEEGEYEVNDVSYSSVMTLDLSRRRYNAGLPTQFYAAFPTDAQIKNCLNVYPSDLEIEVLGDDTHIYVNSALDGYPLGEMICLSHDSLSPIRKNKSFERMVQ